MTDVSNTEANTEAKAPKEITTAKHARFLAETARKRAAKFRAQADEADAAAANYDELAATLPESNPSSSGGKVRPVIEVGTAVTFRFGRTTSTSKARILDGVVKARKDDTDGKPEAYKIAVGSGFDEELFTVQPGAILLAGESAAGNDYDATVAAALVKLDVEINTTEGL